MLVLGAALGTGCSGGSTPDAGMPSSVDGFADIGLELGTGQLSYETVPPYGARVELIHGPQGGYHVYGRYRFAGFGPDINVTFRVTPAEGGAPVNDPTYRVHRLAGRGLAQWQSGWECSSPELVILTQVHGPGDVVGRRFRWEVFVQDVATQRVATAVREITIVDDVP